MKLTGQRIRVTDAKNDLVGIPPEIQGTVQQGYPYARQKRIDLAWRNRNLEVPFGTEIRVLSFDKEGLRNGIGFLGNRLCE
ncbi:hypothetical protein, partial [Ruegeria atlantica]|uniref:hypothetical protein n=1 Tax=Ruegeria atlantica TaxID=81569 RepID=UPI00249547D4